MLLKDPKVALEVYNAMNGTSYDNPDELIITTLENAVYLGMKNDVPFILGNTVSSIRTSINAESEHAVTESGICGLRLYGVCIWG